MVYSLFTTVGVVGMSDNTSLFTCCEQGTWIGIGCDVFVGLLKILWPKTSTKSSASG